MAWIVSAPFAAVRKLRDSPTQEAATESDSSMIQTAETLEISEATQVTAKPAEPTSASDSSSRAISTNTQHPSKGRRWKNGALGMLLAAAVIGFFYPPLITVYVAIVLTNRVFKFTAWVFRENREQLRIFSFWHLLVTFAKFPLYAFPGFLIFFAAAFPLLFVDAIVGAVITGLANAAGSAGGVVDGYLNSPPSVWAVPDYVVWRVISWVIPPTAMTNGSLIMSGVVNWIITLSSILTMLTLAALIVATIRFMIEIWCRCLLASRGAEVSFRLDENDERSGPVTQGFQVTSSVREIVSIPRGTGFYSTTKLRPHGPKGYGKMPHMFTCLIPRIRWGLYRLRHYRAVDRDEDLTYTGGSGAYFIQVRIADEERLCVDLSHLVGFSDQVRLKVRWTSRLSAMLLGRIGYVIASGPGTIVMKATGPPEVLKDVKPSAETNKHFDATCLIAWEPSSQFAIGASGKLLDVYLEPAFLYVRSSPLTLLNPGDAQHSGIFAKLKSWLVQSVVPV